MNITQSVQPVLNSIVATDHYISRYAVVQVFSFGGSNIFYATLNTTEVEEAVVEPGK